MSEHLSPEQVSMWMAGDRTPDGERHVKECTECAAEVARLENALLQFRGLIHEWSAETSARPVWRLPRSVHAVSWVRGLSWAVVPALILLLAMVPILRQSRDVRSSDAKLAQADAQLLEEVDAGVSRAVPQPMEPLLRLVASDSGSTAGTTVKENHETSQ